MTTSTLPLVIAEATVRRVTRLTPSFVRVELGGDALDDLGVDGPLYDQRIKLILPGPAGVLPTFEADESWFTTWQGLPADERGHMRTYTIRALDRGPLGTRLVVDVVVHEDGDVGPGAGWALAARPGSRAVVVGPRVGVPSGGIEFAPGPARRLLLVGDETAVPAIARILADLPPDARGVALVEVPLGADASILSVDTRGPAGVETVWLPRDGAPVGSLLLDAVADRLGASVVPSGTDPVEDEIWETPGYSSSGEPVASEPVASEPGASEPGASEPGASDPGELYAWVAGESGVVTRIRRLLVREHGLARDQVAFMGYWRQGVAMRG